MMNTKKKLSGTALAVAAAGFMGYASLGVVAGSAVAGDNVHCHGVNSCKGHNDCAGANNSCKGMGSCKGQGFLLMSQAECDEKGGTVK